MFKIYEVEFKNKFVENKGINEKYWTNLNGKSCLVRFNVLTL